MSPIEAKRASAAAATLSGEQPACTGELYEPPRRGWLELLARTKREIREDDVSLVAAGVAFYFFLSIFPAVAAAVSIYGLVADPAEIQEQLGSVHAIPLEVREVLTEQLARQSREPDEKLQFTLVGSLLVAIWSASKGMRAMMKAMNIVYDEREERSFLQKTVIALGFTGGAVLLGLLAMAAIVVVPRLFEWMNLGVIGRWGTAGASWVVLVGVFLAGSIALYRWGPSRSEPRWRWLTPGPTLAAVVWLVASALFSLWAANFGSYGETYGSLAAVVVLLLWLWISALVVLVGAELDSELQPCTERRMNERRARDAW